MEHLEDIFGLGAEVHLISRGYEEGQVASSERRVALVPVLIEENTKFYKFGIQCSSCYGGDKFYLNHALRRMIRMGTPS